MTRERIIELLSLLVLELANNVPVPPRTAMETCSSPEEHVLLDCEWAYTKGLAAAQVLRLRDELASAGSR